MRSSARMCEYTRLIIRDRTSTGAPAQHTHKAIEDFEAADCFHGLAGSTLIARALHTKDPLQQAVFGYAKWSRHFQCPAAYAF